MHVVHDEAKRRGLKDASRLKAMAEKTHRRGGHGDLLVALVFVFLGHVRNDAAASVAVVSERFNRKLLLVDDRTTCARPFFSPSN